jgi:tetratricopeptide (TPR) repeat protein
MKPLLLRFPVLLAALVISITIYSQDKDPPGEKPEKKEKQQEPATQAQEESRRKLLQRLKARKLIRQLSAPEKKTAALAELEKIGTEALREMLASKTKEAANALKELCRGWVGQLENEDFKVRDRAFRLLYVAGDAGLEPLKKVAASENAHLSQKAKLLLHMVDYQISPELHARLGHVMADFKEAGWRKKIDIIAELERLGGALAIPALKQIILRETNPRVQAQAANSLIRVGTLEDLLFLKKTGLAEKIQAPAITAEIYLSQGIKYMEAKRYDEAVEEFKKALKDSPGNFRTHYEIAMAYLLSKKYALSVTHYKKCLKQQPNNYLAHYNLACAYSLMNNVDNALKHLTLSVENGYRDISHMDKDKDLDNIRSDQRYKDLKNKLESQTEPSEDKPPEKDK